MDIEKLLLMGEGKTVEFKRDLSNTYGLLKTIVAFSNTSGGVIVIGVDDNKSIRGIDDPLKLEEKLSNIICDSVAPQVLPNIETVHWRNKALLAVEVFSGSRRPYFIKSKGPASGVFIRVGSSNRIADTDLIDDLKRYSLNRCFDEEPFLEKNSEGLDLQSISGHFSRLGKKLNTNALKSLHIETLSHRTVVPTVGGYILFGKDRLDFFPDARMQAALFAGTDKSEMLDSADFDSPLIDAIEQAVTFVKRNIRKTSTFGELHRKDTYRYPLAAVREAVVNSVVHCNYALKGTPITLALFSDRIEITNPGTLPFGLTIDDLYKGVSKLRNRVMGRVFKELRLIEQWGSGVGRIVSECKRAGLLEPRFEEIGTQFRVTLYGTPERAIELSSKEHTIISALQKGKKLSTKDIAGLIGQTERTVRARMIKLIERGLVAEIGSSPQDPHKKYVLAERSSSE